MVPLRENIIDVNFLKKIGAATFWPTFGNIWATFYLNLLVALDLERAIDQTTYIIQSSFWLILVNRS